MTVLRAMVRRRVRVPFVAQTELADCGAAALAMALAVHGRRVALESVRQVVGNGRDGASAAALVDAARQFGLRARGVRADVDEVALLPAGSILFWELNHFVVLVGVRRRGVELVDPAAGRMLVGWDRFRRAYTGVALQVEPAAGFTPGDSRPRGRLRRHSAALLAHPAALARVLATSVLLRLFALALPLLTGTVVDRVVPVGDRPLLAVAAAAVAAMSGFTVLATWVRSRLLLGLRTAIDLRTTTGFLEHLLALPYAFHLRRSPGDLMMRLRSNAVVREVLTTGALSALLDGVLVGAYLVLLLVADPVLGLLVLALGAAQIGVLLAAHGTNQRLAAETLQAEARTQSHAYQLFSGVQTLKAAGAEHRGVTHWSGLFVDELNVSVRRGRLTALVDAALAGLRVGSPLAVLCIGATQVLTGTLSLGTLLGLAALAAGFLEPLATLVATGFQLQLLGGYLDRIDDVLDTAPEQHGVPVRPAPRLRGAITAEHLTFRYGPRGPLVVDDVSLAVRPGSTVAIVGRSGSGKTTLAHLLLGLYPPDGGHVRHDGHDLAELDVRTVRAQLGVVTQEPYLFAVSIRQNIALTRPDATLDEVRAAAALACVDGDIEAMAMGYETILVDGGGTVSGGQRQRIALARALVGHPPVLLLDEATSHLDTVTEARVQANLARLGCTTIVVAHRLSTIRHADQIVVVDAGRVVERGTHAELLALGGHYAALAATQSDDEGIRDGIRTAAGSS